MSALYIGVLFPQRHSVHIPEHQNRHSVHVINLDILNNSVVRCVIHDQLLSRSVQLEADKA
jgi:hypothetical protein